MISYIKRHKFLALGILVLLLLILGRGIFFKSQTATKQTATVSRGDVTEELTLSGKIDASERVTLQFLSPGKLTWIGVKEGDTVQKGQAIAKLDTIELNAAYQKALSDLRSADATVNKIHDNLKGKDGSESYTEVETRTAAEVAKDKAYENVQIARKELANSTIYSPIYGIVSEVTSPNPGVNVSTLDAKFQIVNPKTISFIVTADQTEVVKLHNNDRAEITLDSYPEEKITAYVTRIALTPKANETSTVYEIEMELATTPSALTYRIGMTGDASFITQKKQNVLYVPLQFIKEDTKGKYLFVGPNSEKRYIQTGLEGEDRVEVTGSISEGEQIHD